MSPSLDDVLRALGPSETVLKINLGLTLWVAADVLVVGVDGDTAPVRVVDVENVPTGGLVLDGR